MITINKSDNMFEFVLSHENHIVSLVSGESFPIEQLLEEEFRNGLVSGIFDPVTANWTTCIYAN